MDQTIITKDIRARLEKMQSEMNEIREHLNDITLSADDMKAIEQGEADFKAGRTRRL